jgi:hypothetical protein
MKWRYEYDDALAHQHYIIYYELAYPRKAQGRVRAPRETGLLLEVPLKEIKEGLDS